MVNFNEMLLNSKLSKLRQEYYVSEEENRIKCIKEMGLLFLTQQMEKLADVRVEKTNDGSTEVLWKIYVGNDYVGVGFQDEDVYFGEVLDTNAQNWGKLRLQKSSGDSFDCGAKDLEDWSDVFTFIIKNYFVQ